MSGTCACSRAAQGAKGAKSYEKAEDPIYALEHGLPIDFQHYLDHHLELPLSRLFGPMMRNPKDLMSGARTHLHCHSLSPMSRNAVHTCCASPQVQLTTYA